MLKLDTLNQLKQLKSDIKASRNLMNGTVKGSTNKFGFVTLDSGKDVYLPPEEMEKVLPGDRIEVEIVKDAKKKKVAKIEQLLESPTKIFCGKYITKGKAHFIEPDIQGMNRWFFVPPQKRKNAQTKDLVQCRIVQHPIKSGKAQAAVLEVLGTEQKIGIERTYSCTKYGLSTEFSEAIDTQLAALSESNIDSLKENRTDFTTIPFITIDAETTADIDDALSVEENEKGWKLYVAIADPGALVEPGSPIEKQAIKRATSVYFPNHSVPMLPDKIASDLCSLKEGHVRLAKVLTLQVNKNGELGDYELELGYISSRKKMSYDGVSEAISMQTSDIDEELRGLLITLQQVTDALRLRRSESALVQEARQDFSLVLNDQLKISEIVKKEFTVAHRIVEESMVAANRCVAKYIKDSQLDSLFTKHGGVRQDRVDSLHKVLNENLASFQGRDLTQFSDFVETLKNVRSDADLNEYDLLVSRQLEKSTLSSKSGPHYGMGLSEYLTFTSPLRKAQDYLVHRQLTSMLTGSPEPIDSNLINDIEASISAARGAVYDTEQWLKCQFMSKNRGKHKAKVLRTFSTGFQVQLFENGIEGFISTKEMEGKYSFSQERLTLKGKDQSFKLDQVIDVELKQVDWSRKQLQFAVVLESNANTGEST